MMSAVSTVGIYYKNLNSSKKTEDSDKYFDQTLSTNSKALPRSPTTFNFQVYSTENELKIYSIHIYIWENTKTHNNHM